MSWIIKVRRRNSETDAWRNSETDAWRNVAGADIPSWAQGRGFGVSGSSLSIMTRGILIEVPAGHWLVRGDDGEPIPMSPVHFSMSYERVR